jgi:UBX domain-containing protein 1
MSKFTSLESMRKDEEAKKDKNEYYAGGNDARGGGSGLAVEGRPEHVKKLYEQAAGHGRGVADRPEGTTATKVTLYKNGFIVDGGEFRDLEIPENRAFMDTLTAGHVPKEVRVDIYL